MKNVGIISVNHNAASIMTSYIQDKCKDFKIFNYLDTGLMELVNCEGKVTNNSINRLFALFNNIGPDNLNAILLTCTVFSPYIDIFNSLFTVPIISVDKAMIDNAVLTDGKTMILCTFPATVESTTFLFKNAEKKNSVKRNMKIELLKNAYDALQNGDKEKHDSIILNAIHQYENDFDQIILAQISMSYIATMDNFKKPIITSPSSALASLQKALL